MKIIVQHFRYFVILLLVLNLGLISCRDSSSSSDEVTDLTGDSSSPAVVVSGSQTASDDPTITVTTKADGTSDTTITAGATDHAPTWASRIDDFAMGHGIDIGKTADATDSDDGDVIEYTLDVADETNSTCVVEGAWNPTLAIDSSSGVISGKPSMDDVGSCTIKVIATSEGVAIEDSFEITITESELPPSWDNLIGDFSLAEDSDSIGKSAKASDDNSGDTVSYSLDTSSMTCDDGSWSPNISIDSTSGALSGTPINADAVAGTCTVRVVATSGGDPIYESLTVTITDTNDPPTWDSSIGNFNLDEDSDIGKTVEATDPDPSAIAISYSLDLTSMTCDDGAWAALQINSSSGVLSGAPTNSDAGSSCTIKVIATAGSDTIDETFTVTVDNTNDLPTWDALIGDFSLSETVAISKTAAATDVDTGDTATYSLDTANMDCDDGAWSPNISIAANGVFSGTPTNADAIDGDCTVKVVATAGGDPISETFTITVTNVNDPPTWDYSIGNFNMNEDSDVGKTASATDPDTDPVTYSLDTANMTCDDGAWSPAPAVTLNGGVISGTPTNADVGSCTIKVVATANGQTDTETFTVTVDNTNDVPTWSSEIADFNIEVNTEISGKTTLAVDVDSGDTPAYTIDTSNSTCDDGSWSPQIAIGSVSGALTGKPKTSDIGTCTVRIVATSNGDPINSDITITVDPSSNPPTKLALVGPSGIVAGDCAPFEIQTWNSSNLPANVGADETVTLGVNNGSGTWYSDSNCSSSTTTAVIANGTYTKIVYISDNTAPQSLTLTATSASYLSANTGMAVGSTPTALVVSGAPEAETSVCNKYTVDRIDALGNKLADDIAVQVNLSENGSGTFYSDSGCSASISSIDIPINETGIDFYVEDGSVESITVTAADNATTLTQDTFNISFVTSITWWNTSWNKRVRITVNNLDQATAFSNFPVLIKLTEDRVDYNDVKALGADIRFINSANAAELKYEIDHWSEGGDSYIWVEVDTILASSTGNYIYMYYSNSGASDNQDAASIWTDYWSVWHFDEATDGSPDQLKDSTSLTGNHGKAFGYPTPIATTTPGNIGNAMDFTGSDDVVQVNNDLSTVIGATSTFSCWIKTNQVGNDTMWTAPGITGIEQDGGGNDIFFGWIDASGRIGVTAGNGDPAKSNFVVNDNVWRHVTITRNHSSGAVQFFINGVLNGSGTSEVGLKTSSFTDFGIIADLGGTPIDLDGLLDEIRIFSGVQSNARILADYKYMTDAYFTYANPETKP